MSQPLWGIKVIAHLPLSKIVKPLVVWTDACMPHYARQCALYLCYEQRDKAVKSSTLLPFLKLSSHSLLWVRFFRVSLCLEWLKTCLSVLYFSKYITLSSSLWEILEVVSFDSDFGFCLCCFTWLVFLKFLFIKNKLLSYMLLLKKLPAIIKEIFPIFLKF